jgi:hypothetical protein
MKKVLLTAVAVFGFAFANAQEVRFGAKAGIDVASVKVKVPAISFFGFNIQEESTVTASETGFFVGGFAEIGLNDKMKLQPEVNYVAIDNFNMINVPIMLEYSIVDKFGITAGPSLNYLLDAEEDEFKANFDLGAFYDITEDLEVGAKYSLGFGDVSLSGFFAGVGYKF